MFLRSAARVYELFREGKWDDALALQRKLALAESLTKAGIANTKFAAAINTAPMAGIQRAEELLRPRSPYEEPAEIVKNQFREVIASLTHLEHGHGRIEQQTGRLEIARL